MSATVDIESGKPKSDLKVRVISAIVMVVIAGAALWAGGGVFTAFVAVVVIGLLWEWSKLVGGITSSNSKIFLWMLGGTIYLGMAAFSLISLRNISIMLALAPLIIVIGTDVGAYFSGRAIGGPKIAPAISPSKTWSGLVGGAIAALVLYSLAQFIYSRWFMAGSVHETYHVIIHPIIVLGLAVLAQIGDFFESWMKRTAGVKDSSNLIPGHGGLFDRVDGLLPVLIVSGFLAS